MSDGKHRVRVEMDKFLADAREMLGKDWPMAVTKAFALTAKRVEMMERAHTRDSFKLHSNWIPRNIKAFPRTQAQIAKVASDFKRKHEGYASVSTSQNIEYMSMQEDGATKNPKGSALAIPGNHTRIKLLNSKGQVKDRYKPKKLLEAYNKNNWHKGTKHPNSHGTGKKDAFVIIGKGGTPLLVRRRTKKSRPLETLYVFKASAKIKARWNFEEKGYQFIAANYDRWFNYALQTVIKKYSAGK